MSGSNDKLVAFLYILLRDYLPSGVVEGIMIKHVERCDGDVVFSNPFTEGHARELASRMVGR
jgi:hypothetical protein